MRNFNVANFSKIGLELVIAGKTYAGRLFTLSGVTAYTSGSQSSTTGLLTLKGTYDDFRRISATDTASVYAVLNNTTRILLYKMFIKHPLEYKNRVISISLDTLPKRTTYGYTDVNGNALPYVWGHAWVKAVKVSRKKVGVVLQDYSLVSEADIHRLLEAYNSVASAMVSINVAGEGDARSVKEDFENVQIFRNNILSLQAKVPAKAAIIENFYSLLFYSYNGQYILPYITLREVLGKPGINVWYNTLTGASDSASDILTKVLTWLYDITSKQNEIIVDIGSYEGNVELSYDGATLAGFYKDYKLSLTNGGSYTTANLSFTQDSASVCKIVCSGAPLLKGRYVKVRYIFDRIGASGVVSEYATKVIAQEGDVLTLEKIPFVSSVDYQPFVLAKWADVTYQEEKRFYQPPSKTYLVWDTILPNDPRIQNNDPNMKRFIQTGFVTYTPPAVPYYFIHYTSLSAGISTPIRGGTSTKHGFARTGVIIGYADTEEALSIGNANLNPKTEDVVLGYKDVEDVATSTADMSEALAAAKVLASELAVQAATTNSAQDLLAAEQAEQAYELAKLSYYDTMAQSEAELKKFEALDAANKELIAANITKELAENQQINDLLSAAQAARAQADLTQDAQDIIDAEMAEFAYDQARIVKASNVAQRIAEISAKAKETLQFYYSQSRSTLNQSLFQTVERKKASEQPERELGTGTIISGLKVKPYTIMGKLHTYEGAGVSTMISVAKEGGSLGEWETRTSSDSRQLPPEVTVLRAFRSGIPPQDASIDCIATHPAGTSSLLNLKVGDSLELGGTFKDVFIVDIRPGMRVTGVKSEKGSEWVELPTSYYEVDTNYLYSGRYMTAVLLHTPLHLLPGGYSENLLVAVDSSVYLASEMLEDLAGFLGLPIRSDSDLVATRPNFVAYGYTNVLDTLHAIVEQSCCGYHIAAGDIKVTSLLKEPNVVFTLTADDVASYALSTSDVLRTVGNTLYTWANPLSSAKNMSLALANTPDYLYERTNKSVSVFDDKQQASAFAKFDIHRNGRIWLEADVLGVLNALHLEPYDVVALNVDGISVLAEIVAVTYDHDASTVRLKLVTNDSISHAGNSLWNIGSDILVTPVTYFHGYTGEVNRQFLESYDE